MTKNSCWDSYFYIVQLYIIFLETILIKLKYKNYIEEHLYWQYNDGYYIRIHK